MNAAEMENIISEVEHSLAVEGLTMTDGEKENLRRIGRGEVTYDDLIAQYTTEGRKMPSSHASDGSAPSGDNECDPHDPNRYKGTDVLVNRFGIRDYDELAELECAIAGVTMARLEAEPVEGNYDLAHLKAIHKGAFGALYGWAGQIRQQEWIAKDKSLFCGPEFIEPSARDLFSGLHRENLIRDLPREKFAARMAHYAGDIDALHPFREGNGRTQRIFINQLARQAGWELNLWSVEPDVLLEAFKASMCREGPLAALLEESISPLT